MNPVGFIEGFYDIYINEEKGVVVAKISESDFAYLLLDEVCHLERKTGGLIDLKEAAYKYAAQVISQREISFIAKAKCNYEAGEIWNEEIGVELAVRRLTNQVLHMELMFWDKMAAKLGDVFSRAANHEVCYERRINDNCDAKARLSAEAWGIE